MQYLFQRPPHYCLVTGTPVAANANIAVLANFPAEIHFQSKFENLFKLNSKFTKLQINIDLKIIKLIFHIDFKHLLNSTSIKYLSKKLYNQGRCHPQCVALDEPWYRPSSAMVFPPSSCWSTVCHHPAEQRKTCLSPMPDE